MRLAYCVVTTCIESGRLWEAWKTLPGRKDLCAQKFFARNGEQIFRRLCGRCAQLFWTDFGAGKCEE